MASLGWAGAVGLLTSRGDGAAVPGACPAGADTARRASIRWSETRAPPWGALLQRIRETPRRIGVARITLATSETGTAYGPMRSRTACRERVRAGADAVNGSTPRSLRGLRHPGQSASAARRGAEHATLCCQFCAHSGQ